MPDDFANRVKDVWRRNAREPLLDDPLRRVIDALQRNGCDPLEKGPNQYKSRCPEHQGSRRNLSIDRGDDGRVLLHCFHVNESGRQCSPAAIVEAIGMTMADLYPRDGPRQCVNGVAARPRGKPPARQRSLGPGHGEPTLQALARKLADQYGPLAGTWTYQDADGRDVFAVLRFEGQDGKEFRPTRPTPKGWLVGDPPGPLPLYHLPELAAATRVHVTEGEKAADAVRSLGAVATTSAHGAQSPAKSDWQPLAGKDVVILPDHDPAGDGYAKRVIERLARLEPRPTVRVVQLDALWQTFAEIPDGADAVEWVDIGVPEGWDNDKCRTELERVAEATLPVEQESLHAAAEPIKPRARLTRASNIEDQPLEWLWKPRIPLGMLTLFAGDPKLGKSLSALAIAAAVSRGEALPMDRAPAGPASVILMSAEDDPARIIVPRLKAAGADLARIHVLESIILPGSTPKAGEREPRTTERPPSIVADDVDVIEAAAAQVGDCRLIVIDPVTAYLHGIDDHRNTELRGVLWPLKTMAERRNAAVILVTHMSKGGATQAKHRVIGSIAYVGACRANFLFVKDSDDPSRRRVLMCDNGTNLAPEVPTLSYTVEDRGEGPTVAWGTEPVLVTADEALQAQSRDADQQAERRECDQWLRETLAGGPMPTKEVWCKGKAEGFSRDSLKRAKARIGATTHRDRFGGKCSWRLGSACTDEDHPTIQRT